MNYLRLTEVRRSQILRRALARKTRYVTRLRHAIPTGMCARLATSSRAARSCERPRQLDRNNLAFSPFQSLCLVLQHSLRASPSSPPSQAACSSSYLLNLSCLASLYTCPSLPSSLVKGPAQTKRERPYLRRSENRTRIVSKASQGIPSRSPKLLTACRRRPMRETETRRTGSSGLTTGLSFSLRGVSNFASTRGS